MSTLSKLNNWNQLSIVNPRISILGPLKSEKLPLRNYEMNMMHIFMKEKLLSLILRFSENNLMILYQTQLDLNILL